MILPYNDKPNLSARCSHQCLRQRRLVLNNRISVTSRVNTQLHPQDSPMTTISAHTASNWFQKHQLDRQSTRDQRSNELHQPSKPKHRLINTLHSSQQHGHLVLSVTLTPDVAVTEYVANSRFFRALWDSTLLHQVRRRIPAKHQQDHLLEAYSIELGMFKRNVPGFDHSNDNGLWHFHGVLVIHKDHRDRFWKNGALHKAFERDLRSLHGKGKNHSYPIRSICVEILAANESERLPHRDTHGLPAIESWINYASKPWCWKAKSIWQED